MKASSVRLRALAAFFVLTFCAIGICGTSCQPAFPTSIQPLALSINITGGNIGTATDRLPLNFVTPDIFTVHIEALDQNGNVDPTFTGYVRLSIQPGTVLAVNGDNSNGRNVELINGTLVHDVQVSVVGASGDAVIVAQDLGYQPASPLGVKQPDGSIKLPQCANGIDDNDNGLVDYPVDPGCYAANDDTENGGTYASASTATIFFEYPRIADVEGINNGGAGTPFPNEAVTINTEWNGTTANTPQGVVVTGVASTGFFVTDIGETQGYGSVYAYTYSAPTLLNVCDRLITFGGTAAEFFGFLEINYPTWSLEEWDPAARPCLVPEPTYITVATLTSASPTSVLVPLESGLVRVPEVGGTITVASKIGPGLVTRLYKCTNGTDPSPNTGTGTCSDGSVPTFSTIATPIQADATSCDFEGTGTVTFDNVEEAACETACEADIQCSEYTAYQGESQFQLVVTNPAGTSQAAITADGALDPSFSAVELRGQPLLAFTGNLTYFSGGSQFTVQARCVDDIVRTGGTILPSSPPWPAPDGGAPAPAACVVNRALTMVTN